MYTRAKSISYRSRNWRKGFGSYKVFARPVGGLYCTAYKNLDPVRCFDPTRAQIWFQIPCQRIATRPEVFTRPVHNHDTIASLPSTGVHGSQNRDPTRPKVWPDSRFDPTRGLTRPMVWPDLYKVYYHLQKSWPDPSLPEPTRSVHNSGFKPDLCTGRNIATRPDPRIDLAQPEGWFGPTCINYTTAYKTLDPARGFDPTRAQLWFQTPGQKIATRPEVLTRPAHNSAPITKLTLRN